MDFGRSPLAPDAFPDLPQLPGVTIRTARAGYRDWQRSDITAILLPEGTHIAGLFTQSQCPSPEVEWCREAIRNGKARAIIVNAGNANAFTGGRGKAAVEGIVDEVSTTIGCTKTDVMVSSTGVIGEPLPIDKARAGIAAIFQAADGDWHSAAQAIGTTDTFPKAAMTHAMIGDSKVTLIGIIKGSGMIEPDMATMLGYIVTDAAIGAAAAQQALAAANGESFGCITVDSDTSTSDTVLLAATGSAENTEVTGPDSMGYDAFAAALKDLCQQLAKLVVRDGEGASKFITIRITGAQNDESAHIIGKSIANSPLVKTAIAGGDANWGRVVMAVGKAGQRADRDRLSIAFGGVTVARDGMVAPDYDEAPVAEHLSGRNIDLAVDLGIGTGRATIWTCDLTHGYISINADYRS